MISHLIFIRITTALSQIAKKESAKKYTCKRNSATPREGREDCQGCVCHRREGAAKLSLLLPHHPLHSPVHSPYQSGPPFLSFHTSLTAGSRCRHITTDSHTLNTLGPHLSLELKPFVQFAPLALASFRRSIEPIITSSHLISRNVQSSHHIINLATHIRHRQLPLSSSRLLNTHRSIQLESVFPCSLTDRLS